MDKEVDKKRFIDMVETTAAARPSLWLFMDGKLTIWDEQFTVIVLHCFLENIKNMF